MLGFRNRQEKKKKEKATKSVLGKDKKKKKKGSNQQSFEIRLAGDLEELDRMWAKNLRFPNNPKRNVMQLDITPKEGLWKDYTHSFEIKVEKGWPWDPPKCKCLTKIWHPNIDKDGAVCLNILRKDYTPTVTINLVCIGLNFLFDSPNSEDPLNYDAADMMDQDLSKFERKARQYMQDYAECTTVKKKKKKYGFY